MPSAEVIKDYLVKLGFAIDSPAQAKIQQALRELDSSLTKVANNKGMATLIKGSVAYVGVLAMVATGFGTMMKKMADADMEHQKNAIRLHMNTEAAKAYSLSLRALGASLGDVVWNPELKARYHELNKQIRETSAPKEAQAQFRLIRDIGFEFTKMKTLISQAMEWITMNIAKRMDLAGFRDTLRRITEYLKENLPKWTAWIANFAVVVFNVFSAIGKIGMGVFNVLKGIFEIIPKGMQGVALVIGALAAAFALNPVIAGLTLIFGMIEDWYVWSQGKKGGYKTYTMFEELWEGIDGVADSLSAPLTRIKTAMTEIMKGLRIDTNLKRGWQDFGMALREVASVLERIGGAFQLVLSVFALLDQRQAKNKLSEAIVRNAADKSISKEEREKRDFALRKEMSELEWATIKGVFSEAGQGLKNLILPGSSSLTTEVARPLMDKANEAIYGYPLGPKVNYKNPEEQNYVLSTMRQGASGGKGESVTMFNIQTVKVQANNPEEFGKEMDRKKRVGN